MVNEPLGDLIPLYKAKENTIYFILPMSYPDYATRLNTVSGDSWSVSEAKKKVTEAFPSVYTTHAETGLEIAWDPAAYKKDAAKRTSMEDAVAAFYAAGLFVDKNSVAITATGAVIRYSTAICLKLT